MLLNRLLPKRERKTNTPGLWIALYGPDGAGKSSLAARLAAELEPWFSRVQLHHLRIPLWPSSRPSSIVTNPHAQPPRGPVLSYLKLVYMFAQSWPAHLLRTLPGLASGQLLIVDRYFLDYAVDPKRYRLAASSVGLASLLSRFAPQPDLQFVLDVPAQELQRRKSEVSLSESQRQRQEYAARIAVLPNALLVNANRPVDEVAVEITSDILEWLSRHSSVGTEADLASV